MNILVINTLYSPNIGGGAEIICQEQAEGLAVRGHHVAVLTTGPKGTGLKQDVVNGLTVYRAGIKNVYWQYGRPTGKLKHFLWHLWDIYNSKMMKFVENVINKEKPDIVLCHNMAGFSVSAWTVISRHKIPIVEVLHDQYLRCPNSNAFKNNIPCKGQCLMCKLMRLPHRKMTDKVSAVIGVSSFVLNSLTTLGLFRKSEKFVIHNARNFQNAKTATPWNGNETLKLGYIGTLSEVKGVEWLIRSFMSLNINASLTIAGKGITKEYEDHLKELASTDKRITFTGYTRPENHYPNIHVSVVPSLWPDTFPTVAFESCAYGVPVIATNRGGLPEIIHEGNNGCICDADNPESLKEKIMCIYNSPEQVTQMSEGCKASVAEMTDEKGWIDKIEKILVMVSIKQKGL